MHSENIMKKWAIALILVFPAIVNHGQNVLYSETFAACVLPSEWESTVEYGGADWEVVDNNRADPDYGDECLLYFLDIKKPGKGDSSNIWMASPWVNPINSDSVFIDFLLNFVKIDGKPQILDIYYEKGNQRHLYASFDSSVWGATFNEYVPQTIRIANNDNTPFRVVINFNNHGEQNSVVSLDNFVFRGFNNGICENAVDIRLDATACYEGNNQGIHSTTVTDACSGIQTIRPIWYRFIADRSGFIKLTTSAAYNDVVDVYYGICDDLIPFRCSNKDEYGFTGEEMYFRCTNGVVYYIRLSAWDAPYSTTEGQHCLLIEEVSEIPSAPDYDFCSGAQELTLDADCVEALTYYAETTDPVPSLNEKSRADVWYKYLHMTSDPITLRTNADFSDVITIYQGNCFGLLEVTGTDQGPEMVNFELKEGLEYYIKVSGYFSTTEGRVCASIVKAGNQVPENDLCEMAENVTIKDTTCIEASTSFAGTSQIKSSCQIKPGPDLWYQFKAPASGAVVVQVDAEFIFDIALYSGTCDSLVEKECRNNPHRCDGYITFDRLIPDTTYYLQIASHINSFGALRGDLCLAVYETGEEPEFDALTANAEIECQQDLIGILNLDISGGQGAVEVTGNRDGDWLLPGEKFYTIIEDASGCREIVEGISPCEGAIDCDSSDLEIVIDYQCELDHLGLQTGRAIVQVDVIGGTGQIQRYGSQDGEIVLDGSELRVGVVDESGCLKVESMTVSCQAFTCDQSDLALSVDYQCIDSLLRAELIVSAVDGNGQYEFGGDLNGDLLEDGQSFISIVTDEAGCTDTISGIIDCNFDSCAYSALSVEVDYECVTDLNGLQTGAAILSISTSGGIGQLTFQGGQDGDTLYNGDTYNLNIIDEWGCTVNRQGLIECAPTSNHEVSKYKFRKVYPVPATEFIIVEYFAEMAREVNFTLWDASGRLAWQYESSCQAGVNKMPLIFGRISAGVYQLRATEEGNTYTTIIAIAD